MLAAPAPLAFIGATELLVIGVVGLLLFGGDLPKVMADLGRAWVKLRRAMNEFKRESGIDDAMREIRRETDFRVEEPRWRREMDHAAGPARAEPPAEARADPEAPPAAAEPPRPADVGPSEPA
jgi:Sec-independent protein translocase protein TatA